MKLHSVFTICEIKYLHTIIPNSTTIIKGEKPFSRMYYRSIFTSKEGLVRMIEKLNDEVKRYTDIAYNCKAKDEVKYLIEDLGKIGVISDIITKCILLLKTV